MSVQLEQTVTADTRRARQLAGLRHSSLGLAVALLVEYALGIGGNLYIAAVSGTTFVDSAHDSASLAMGLLTALALFCAVLNLHKLGNTRAAPRPDKENS